ncbi:hypothetical protein FRC17_001809 [Serendipita sp. 399]|nr:hypothetical protein FRC17_001809 [Serendipita sp. 399]
MSKVVFVGNIPYDYSEEQLTQIFSTVGPVTGFRLVFERGTGKPKGYGFCEYADHETAASAVRNLNGKEVGGRALRIDLAESDPSLEGRSTSFGELLDDERKDGIDSWLSSFPPGVPVPPGKTSLDVITETVVGVGQARLFDAIHEMKGMINQEPEHARALLVANPQLASALLQAMVVHNVVDQGVLARLQVPDAKKMPPAPQNPQYPQHSVPPSGLWPPPPPAPFYQASPIPPPAPHPQAQAPPPSNVGNAGLDPQQQAMLMQVLSLTMDQINALPVNEREAIIQLRKQFMPGT